MRDGAGRGGARPGEDGRACPREGEVPRAGDEHSGPRGRDDLVHDPLRGLFQRGCRPLGLLSRCAYDAVRRDGEFALAGSVNADVIAELCCRLILTPLPRVERWSEEFRDNLLTWVHTGFSVFCQGDRAAMTTCSTPCAAPDGRSVRRRCCRDPGAGTVAPHPTGKPRSEFAGSRGAPQSGLANDIQRMRSRISREIAGRPGLPDLRSLDQYARNLLGRQATTVSGWTVTHTSRHCGQTREGKPRGDSPATQTRPP